MVDWAAVGYPGVVYVPMALDTDADRAQILAALRGIAGLRDLVAVTGSYDMIAQFRIMDHAQLQAFLLDRIWPIRALQRIETFRSLSDVVRKARLSELLEGRPSGQGRHPGGQSRGGANRYALTYGPPEARAVQARPLLAGQPRHRGSWAAWW